MDGITIDELIELESGVWRALVAGDPEADAAMLSDDFLGVYPSGFADRAGHAAQLAAGPTVSRWEIAEARAFEVSASAVMLSYRAAYRRPDAPAGRPDEVMYVSSLWCRRDGHWINVFSQDTPAA